MQRFMSLASLLACFPAFALAADLPPITGDAAIVSPDAKLELLFTRSAKIKGGLTEGPAVAPDGSIYFSDIPLGTDRGMILRFDPTTKQTKVFAEDSKKSNGLIFDSQGFLLSAEGSDVGGRAVSRWNTKTVERKTVVERFQGKHFNAPNDLCLDREGRIYFTDPRYLGDEPRELEHRAVYRINKDNSVVEITHDIAKPNGIAITPDGKILVVADHDNGTDKIDPTKPDPKIGNQQIVAFDLDKEGLVTGKKRVLIDYGTAAGCDGMTVDSEGRIYLTVRDTKRPGIQVIDVKGKELAFIPTGPANQKGESLVGLPSNVEFGIGDEISTLYITIDVSLYRIPLKAKGYHVQFEKK